MGLLLVWGKTVDARIDLCHRRLLSRAPTANELASSRQFLSSEADRLRAEGRSGDQLALPDATPADVDHYESAALVEFCLAMFNSNEFVYVD